MSMTKLDGARQLRFSAALDLMNQKMINVAAGTADTDAINKLQLDTAIAGLVAGLEYKGSFDASAGSFPSDPEIGNFYKVSVGGTVDGLELTVGDMIIANKSVEGASAAADWDKIDNTEAQTLASVLGFGNSTGANDIVVTAGQKITTDTIAETTADAGVTVDGVLLKDGQATLTADPTANLQAATKQYVDKLTTFEYNESLTVTNGSPAVSELAYTPVAASVRVYLNGMRQAPTDDYTISGKQITFTFNLKNVAGNVDKVLVDYLRA